MIKAYDHLYKDIDHVVIYMQYTTDLKRDTYSVSNRFELNTPLNRFLKQIKTVVYLRDIGLMDPITHSIDRIKDLMRGKVFSKDVPEDSKKLEQADFLKLENFKRLVKEYEYDKIKNVLLLDYRDCSPQFTDYLEQNGFKTIDFSTAFKDAKIPPTLIYDQHWSNHGRSIIANMIADYIEGE